MSLQTDLYDIFQPIFNESVIWANQNVKRPATPFVTFRLDSVSKIDEDYKAYVDNNGVQAIKGNRTFTLEIQRFGSDSVIKLHDFINKLGFESTIKAMALKKVAYVSHTAINNLSGIIDDGSNEDRAQVDLTLNWAVTSQDNVGIIEQVNVNADDNSTAPQFTVEITLQS